MQKCPRCGSDKTEQYFFSKVKVLKCNSCGYDEGIEFGQNPSNKTNQKEKSRYSPYKTGGSKRTRKS